MDPQTARLDRSGRLVLPATIRRDLELREGDEVVFTAGDSAGEVRLTSRRAALDEAQELVKRHIPTGVRLVDELLADRRREAANDAPRRGRRSSRAGAPPT